MNGKIKLLLIIISSVIIGLVLFLLLINYCIDQAIENDDGYCPIETYGNFTIVATKYEARIDDSDNNTGQIIVHNVLYCGVIGTKMYIVDRDHNRIIIGINTKDIRKYTKSDNKITKKEMDIFDSLGTVSECYDFLYIYESQ